MEPADTSQGVDLVAGPFPMYALVERVLARYEQYAVSLRAQLELSANEYLILQQLLTSGPLTSAELSRRIGVTTASMAALVSGLEERGFVHRVPDTNDGRRILTYASKGMVNRMAQVVTALGADIQRLAEGLSDSDRQAVENFLRGVADAYGGPS